MLSFLKEVNISAFLNFFTQHVQMYKTLVSVYYLVSLLEKKRSAAKNLHKLGDICVKSKNV